MSGRGDASLNLPEWLAIATPVAGADGAVDFAEMPDGLARFYRTVELPLEP